MYRPARSPAHIYKYLYNLLPIKLHGTCLYLIQTKPLPACKQARKQVASPAAICLFILLHHKDSHLPHRCSVTTNAQGDEGEKMEAVTECCAKRRICSLSAPFVPPCGPDDDDDDDDHDCCWLSLNTWLLARSRRRSKKKWKELRVLLLHASTSQQTVAAAISAHSGFFFSICSVLLVCQLPRPHQHLPTLHPPLWSKC